MQVPIMLRSDYCSLHDQDDMQLQDLGECPYDQVCRTTPMLHVIKRCMQAWVSPTRNIPIPSHVHSLSMRRQRTELVLAVTIKFVVAPKTTMACRVATLSLTAVRRFS